MKMKHDFVFNPREVRRNLGLNQSEFWSRIGVTQSGGSRYETGRRMPAPVRELLRVVHIERIDLAKVSREDYDVLDQLKSQHPELYAELRDRTGEQPVENPMAAMLSDPFSDDLSNADVRLVLAQTE